MNNQIRVEHILGKTTTYGYGWDQLCSVTNYIAYIHSIQLHSYNDD